MQKILDIYVVDQTSGAHPATEPSFFPRPAYAGESSTPAQSPSLNSASPRNWIVPSTPRDSILTGSPRSSAFGIGTGGTVYPWRLDALKTSDCRLAGRDAVDVMLVRGVAAER